MEPSTSTQSFHADTVQYAGFWTRLMAHNVDLMVLLPFLYLLSFLLSKNTHLYLACGALILLYEVGFIGSSWGATPGKRMMKIRVVNSHLQPIGWFWATVRTCLKVFSVATLFLGYAVIVFHPKKQGLHDLIVHSIVIFNPNH